MQGTELANEMAQLGQRARRAARSLSKTSTAQRSQGLRLMAQNLRTSASDILEANHLDLEAADRRGVSAAMRDRLALNDNRIEAMAVGLDEIASQPDPLGAVVDSWERPNGLSVAQIRIPLGVIGIIYEARPNVTADAAGLCLKSGNVVFLRGGSEAKESNHAILKALRSALREAGLPEDALMALPSTDRAWIMAMLHAAEYLDVIIPRGGEGLIRFVTEHARVPVIQHFKGVCHIYVDQHADLTKAEAICENAKVSRPGVCNAMETLLVHRAVAQRFLPQLAQRLSSAGVEFRACVDAKPYLRGAKDAVDDDYHAEFLDLILAVKVVDGLDEAIAHIELYGSDHTESIISEDDVTVERFLREVNSSVVMANASTRFSDGGQLGLGAEIGISTTRLHAYGPMGVKDLTSRKYVITGTGHTRS